jgi:hypothetical protein
MNYFSTEMILAKETPENLRGFGRITLKLGWITRVSNNFGTDKVVNVITSDDRIFNNCTVLDPFGMPDGSGLEVAPLKNTACLLGLADGFTPFVLGFYQMPNLKKGGVVGIVNDDDPLLPGDYRFKTIGGNKIHLYSGGAILVQSTAQCKTLYLPTQGLINHVCKNWELVTDAGFESWRIENNETGDAVYTKKILRKNKEKQLPVFSQRIGSVDKKGTIFSTSFGDGVEDKGDINIYEDGTILIAFKNGTFFQWQNTNQQFDFKLSGFWLQIKEDGTTKISLGKDSTTASISFDAKSNKLSLTNVKGSQQIKMDEESTVIADGKNGNSVVFGKDGIVFQTGKAFVVNGKNATFNVDKIFVGKQAAKSAGNGVVTGFPTGSHPNDYFTGLPIMGIDIFGAG